MSSTKFRIVIIEDEDEVRVMLGLLLDLAGHHVMGAADGPKGIELILESPFTIGIIDLGLPGMDGLEVARQIRERQQTLSPPLLIALTGNDLPRAEVLAAGFNDHLTKPASLKQILQIFQRHLAWEA